MRFARQTTAAVLQRVARDPRWQTILAVSPDAAIAGRHWPRGIARVTQGGGDLGRRMHRLMERLPPGPVAIIGTDVPGIRPGHIAGAFRLLGRRDAVFGPSEDGGYWLVGLKRRPRLLKPFVRVRWSSEHAPSDTLANLPGREIAFVATLRDVDEARDLVTASAVWDGAYFPRLLPLVRRGMSGRDAVPAGGRRSESQQSPHIAPADRGDCGFVKPRAADVSDGIEVGHVEGVVRSHEYLVGAVEADECLQVGAE